MTNAIETRKDELRNLTKMALNKILAQHGSNYNGSKLKTTNKEFIVDDIINYEFPAVEDKTWTCPRCETETTDYPAICREDNKTEICSECGEIQAIQQFNASTAKKVEPEKVEVVEVKETETAKKNGPVSTDDLFDQPLVTKEEVKDNKKPKKQSREKVQYNPIFKSIQNALSEIKINTFEGKNPKRCYLRCNTGNKDFWWVIALSQSRTQLELCGTDLDKLFKVHAEVAKNWKSLGIHHKDGAKRAKIYIEIENHDAQEIAKKWKNFETKVNSKLKKQIESN